MLTNLVERGVVKCLQYWPDSDSKHYGPFKVTITDKQMFADYFIRVFQVEVSMVSKYENTWDILLSLLINYLKQTDYFDFAL